MPRRKLHAQSCSGMMMLVLAPGYFGSYTTHQGWLF